MVAAVAAGGIAASQMATATTGDREAARITEAAAIGPRDMGGAANLTMRFIQEDGPESGHVRVVLTPETRPLTVIEARTAAQQAFLETLNEKGLGDSLSRITVVVRLMPATHPDPEAVEQVIVFLHKGGPDWSVMAGE
jgi:hypothetical protein